MKILAVDKEEKLHQGKHLEQSKTFLNLVNTICRRTSNSDRKIYAAMWSVPVYYFSDQM